MMMDEDLDQWRLAVITETTHDLKLHLAIWSVVEHYEVCAIIRDELEKREKPP